MIGIPCEGGVSNDAHHQGKPMNTQNQNQQRISYTGLIQTTSSLVTCTLLGKLPIEQVIVGIELGCNIHHDVTFYGTIHCSAYNGLEAVGDYEVVMPLQNASDIDPLLAIPLYASSERIVDFLHVLSHLRTSQLRGFIVTLFADKAVHSVILGSCTDCRQSGSAVLFDAAVDDALDTLCALRHHGQHALPDDSLIMSSLLHRLVHCEALNNVVRKQHKSPECMLGLVFLTVYFFPEHFKVSDQVFELLLNIPQDKSVADYIREDTLHRQTSGYVSPLIALSEPRYEKP